jgi:diguanylate cyclase (GGDEF) domain
MFIDLDNFKELNDSKGHHTGDLLLKRIAERLKGAVRSTDVVARWGGDEFVVLIQGLHEDTSRAEKQARLRCSQLLKRLEPTYNLEGFSYTCGVSIGISLFDGSAQDPDEILNQADLAMYEAKQGLAAHSYHFFADSPVTSI